LIVAALKRMQRLDRDGSSRYHRRIDFQRVALVGHSRGGDAFVRAARLVPSNVRVRTLVQLAPTDMTGLLQGAAPTGLTLPAGAPPIRFIKQPITVAVANGPRQLIVWGSRDGDVSGKEDVRADVSVNPFRHYDRSAVERAFQFWHGATHNRFNRLWTDAYEDSNCLSRTDVEPAGLLTRANQEARTVEMVRGWLLFSLFDETTEAGRFDGRTRTAIAPALPIAAMWKFGKRLTTIDQFDDTRPDRNTLGGANITPATGPFDEITLANENGAGAGVTAYQFPHIDRTLRFSPAPTSMAQPVWRTTIPAGSRDLRRFDLLTFRVTKKYDAALLKSASAVTPTIRVRLVGPNPRVTHAEAATGRLSSLPVLRLIPAADCEGPADLTKVHYETWEVSLSAYTAGLGATGIADVHFVEFEIDTEVGQPVYIDTISLV
jgi:pimeloyl-ACP methyl ester carboxylesterase